MMKYNIGDEIVVKITGTKKFGAFFVTEDNISGLIHISEISNRFINDINDLLRVNDRVKIKVIDINNETNKISGSYKAIKTDHINRQHSIGSKNLLDSVYVAAEETFKEINKSEYIKVDYSKTKISKADIDAYQSRVTEIDIKMKNKTAIGSDFLGWYDLPFSTTKEIKEIKEAGLKIHKKSKIVVNIGIGGSYLGLKMALDYLIPTFNSRVEMVYAGHNLSSTYLNNLVNYLENKDFSIIVVSKSGTTTESAIAFRVLEELAKSKFNDYKDRIYCVTDKERGALKEIANNEGYQTFVIPDDVGGRFSVLTAVGLLGISAMGIDIDRIIDGAKKAYTELASDSLDRNDAYKYACIRDIMSKKYSTELLVSYEPALTSFGEWWKQLFGESEGKEGKGLFPTSVSFSTDLHSLGQYIQEGNRIFFETILNVKATKKDITIEANANNYDGLNYLAGKTIFEINQAAFEGTIKAHSEGGVECVLMELPILDEVTLGYLIYFFEKSCAMSAYLLGVNPFDQPGVEQYKHQMFKILGKY